MSFLFFFFFLILYGYYGLLLISTDGGWSMVVVGGRQWCESNVNYWVEGCWWGVGWSVVGGQWVNSSGWWLGVCRRAVRDLHPFYNILWDFYLSNPLKIFSLLITRKWLRMPLIYFWVVNLTSNLLSWLTVTSNCYGMIILPNYNGIWWFQRA